MELIGYVLVTLVSTFFFGGSDVPHKLMSEKKIAPVATLATVPTATPTLAPTEMPVQNIVRLINNERARYGLAPVSENALLDESARLKAQDEVGKGYWAHNSPDGSYFTIFLDQAGYSYVNAAEVLGRRYYDDAELVAAWMVSPTHRAEVLREEWKDVGFARVEEYTVMHFAHR